MDRNIASPSGGVCTGAVVGASCGCSGRCAAAVDASESSRADSVSGGRSAGEVRRSHAFREDPPAAAGALGRRCSEGTVVVVGVGRGVAGRRERRHGGGRAVCGGPRWARGDRVACRGRGGCRHGHVGQRRAGESAGRPHRGVRGRAEPPLHDGPGAVLVSPARRWRGLPPAGRGRIAGCRRRATARGRRHGAGSEGRDTGFRLRGLSESRAARRGAAGCGAARVQQVGTFGER